MSCQAHVVNGKFLRLVGSNVVVAASTAHIKKFRIRVAPKTTEKKIGKYKILSRRFSPRRENFHIKRG